MSKGQTLKQLESKVSWFRVPALLCFTTVEFERDPADVIQKIQNFFKGKLLAIRSSASDEDGATHAYAGAYDSVLSVPSEQADPIRAAIQKVIESYSRTETPGAKSHSGSNEFIVQEMILNTVMSGVVFTHDLNSGAPYYVINYDDVSGLTNTVTSGGGEYANRTLYIHRGATASIRSERFQRLIRAVQELEKIMGSEFLDVEFALGADFTPYLLQARAITTQPHWNRAVAKRIDEALRGIQSFVKMRLEPMTGVFGKTTVLGQMPDWNPAEMIGRAPRALAFSLYKHLITDHAWRIARETMGYAVPMGQPLMVSLGGQPFIDTRLSFHSFLPSGISDEVGHKLVNAWVKRLAENPQLHDKVEFEVAITTFSFDLDQKRKTHVGEVLSDSEWAQFRDLVKRQTLTLIRDEGAGGISSAMKKVEHLLSQQKRIRSSAPADDLGALPEMMDDCTRYGTIPFSILARHAFIARTILLSLERKGVFTAQEIQKIQSSVRTIVSDLVDDARKMQAGTLARDEFMSRYGHLRPGTYDILSRRYDQMEDLGNSGAAVRAPETESQFTLSAKQSEAMEALFREEGFTGLSASAFMDYYRTATAAREYGKFVFTRSVSEMLELIAGFGQKHGLSREELSHVTIGHLLSVLTKSDEGTIEDRLRKIGEQEAERNALCAAIRLPQVLLDEAGVHVVPFQVSSPNFITHKKITAECIALDSKKSSNPDLAGKIVLIENADPGFDWIFSQPISGLITKYGGANSHMAIRCAEFSIPAAIGCGEQRFEALWNSNRILLDCAAGLINPLH